MAVPPAPVRAASRRPLAPSVTSVPNDKGDNETILGSVHISPDICLTAEENPGKPQLGDRLMKGLCDQSSPQMGPFPTNEGGRIAQHVRKKWSKGRVLSCPIFFIVFFFYRGFGYKYLVRFSNE